MRVLLSHFILVPAIMAPPRNQLKSWRRGVDGTRYFCSTDPTYIPLDNLNLALDSDLLWWAKRLPQEELETMVDQSLCFGLYVEKTALPESTGGR